MSNKINPLDVKFFTHGDYSFYMSLGWHDYYSFKEALTIEAGRREAERMIISHCFALKTVVKKDDGIVSEIYELSDKRKSPKWQHCTIAESLENYLKRVGG